MVAEIKLAKDLIQQVVKGLGALKKEQNQALVDVGEALMVDLLDQARFYVEPDCQPYNPADHHEEDNLDADFRKPVLSVLSNFFSKPLPNKDGRNQMFLLADAGMGKTTLMAMLAMAHITRFWAPDYQVTALKLGPDTLNAIQKLEGGNRTILLLDALDEDSTAMGRINGRLEDLLTATQGFRRVLITCRTQFFPEEDVQKAWISIGAFQCPVRYLSLFSEDQVRTYLNKRFPAGWLQKILGKKRPEVDAAQAVVNAMGSLRCRPMLLGYIEDFMEGGAHAGKNSFQIYETLLQAWLKRETRKPGARLKPEELLQACQTLALEMTRADTRSIHPDGDEGLSDFVREELQRLELTGRSLLNKNSSGAFRFAHYSIQEFLVVRGLRQKALGRAFRPSGLMLQFIWDCGFSGLQLAGMDLRGADLNGVDLRDVPYQEVDLSGADLSDAVVGPGILGARLDGAILPGQISVNLPADVVMEMVLIQPGTYLMGSPSDEEGRDNNEEQHQVTISKPFYLGQTAVTQKQWQALMGENPSRFEGDDLPVEQVSWVDVQPFIQKLNDLFQHKAFRLTTEAEWEYACRAGTQTAYAFGDKIPKGMVNFGSNKTVPVKSLPPNDWGLYQMHGNVYEWCQDWHSDYHTEAACDPKGPDTGRSRVIRGGCWISGARLVRSAYRSWHDPGYRDEDLGFRLAIGQ